jgi:hypothetical protein
MTDHHDDNGSRGDWLGYGAIASYAKDHPDLDGEAIGLTLTRGATKSDLRAWAVAQVRGTVEQVRRAWARDAEDRAAKAARAEQEAAEFGRLLDDPAAFYGPRSFYGDARKRARFRQWAGGRFAGWQERARQVVVASGRGEQGIIDFESDWSELGINGYHRRLADDRLADVIRLTADETRLEVTAELLGTAISLGDGTDTTWGQATIAQHEQRIGMLTRHAVGEVESAARHQAAIGMIKDAGVECLADLGPGDGPAPVPVVPR